MRFETTQDVLNHIREFHKKASALYQELAEKEEQKRLQLLLNYMSRHEAHLEQSLAQYEQETSQKILDTWFQYIPDQQLLQPIQDVEVEPNASVQEIVDLAMRLDDCLIALYKEMIEHAAANEVKEVFQNLLEMEKQEQHQLARTTFSGMTDM